MKYVGWLAIVLSLSGCYLNSSLSSLNPESLKGELPIEVPNELTLTNFPSKVIAGGSLDIAVSGANVQSYKYKLGTASSTNCAVSASYSASAIPVSVKITDDVSVYSDQLLKVCVVGISASGVQDDFSQAVSKSWFLDRTPTVIQMNQVEHSAFESDGSNKTLTVTTSVVKPYEIEVDYSLTGDSVYLVNHNLPPKGVIKIPAGKSSGSVTFQVLNDPTGSTNKMFQVSISASDYRLASIGDTYQSRVFIKDTTAASRPMASKVALGGNAACAILTDGSARCWGYNNNGVLGNGTTTMSLTPVVVTSSSSYSQIYVHGSSACAITSTGVLKCWGAGAAGQIGDGAVSDTLTPVTVDFGTSYKSLVKTQYTHNYACGITSTDALKCWGDNSNGQLGDGSTGISTVPITIDSGVGYKLVKSNSLYTCGITLAGVLKCWGSNSSGQLGNDTTNDSYPPDVIDSGVAYASVALGSSSDYSTCAITSLSVLKCWGSNYYGELGDGTTTDKLVPTVVDSGTSYSQVVISGSTACAITTLGILKCWGANVYGQVGDGTLINRSSPVVIDSGVAYSKVVRAGEAYFPNTSVCGITTTGVLKCWGGNASGQLGVAAGVNTRLPSVVDAGTVYSSVEVNESNACGITSVGELKCWGSTTTALRGDASNFLVSNASDVVTDDKFNPSVVSNGKAHCMITSSSQLKCWGENNFGQLGDGSKVNRALPVAIDPTEKYTMVQGHSYSMCGITESGALKCWGMNDGGQLGDGTIVDKSYPVLIDPGTKYSFVATKNGTTCGISIAGVLKCWGRNASGQVGDNTLVNKTSPVVIDLGVSYKRISIAGNVSCGITSTDALKCWGFNGSGNVGDGTTTDRKVPTLINSGTGYAAIEVSETNTPCAITIAGALKCWGYNLFGTVGDGTTVSKLSPIVIDSGTNYSSLSSGSSVMCGITTAGVLKCWGYNGTGAVGDGTITTTKTSPSIADSGVTYAQVKTSGVVTCGITTTGILKCWGYNSAGNLGNGTLTASANPVVSDSGTKYTKINVGGFSACGVTTAGILKCWGDNSLGSIGDGTAYISGLPRSINGWLTP